MSTPVLFSDAPAASWLLPPGDLAALDLVADGHSDGAIAARLGTSVDIVKHALGRIGALLGIRDRAGMVAAAYRAGLLTAPAEVPDGRGRISRQEYECLLLLAAGLSAQGIAARWGMSAQDVRTIIARMRREVAAVNRAHLIRRAIEAGALTLVRKGVAP